jgi:hypothetical protein
MGLKAAGSNPVGGTPHRLSATIGALQKEAQMTQASTDPWAAAQAQQSTPAAGTTQQGNSNGGQKNSGVAANPVTRTDNPFMTSQEAAPAGSFDPFLPTPYMLGRPMVMVPKRFTDSDPKPETMGGGVRDKWTVDIILLGGEPFSFTYKQKTKQDNGPDIETEETFEVTEFPHTFRSQSVWAGQLIGALNGANSEGAFLYGTFTRVPVKQDERAGKTRQQLEQEIAAWRADMAAGKPGTSNNMPRHTYNLVSDPDVFTKQHQDAAVAWWEQEKASRLNTAS